MVKKRVLITYQVPLEGFDILKDDFDLIYPQKEKLSREEVIFGSTDCDALVSVFGHALPDEVMDHPGLQLISNYGAGVDNINIPLATQKGILVTNTPTAVTEPTAEMAMGLMISVMRRIAECDRKLRMENGLQWGVMQNLGYSLYGKTLGIIGMGRIGNAVAERALAFGMHICYHNRSRITEGEEKRLSAEYMPQKEDLLSQSDVVFISTPLTAETRHLMDSKAFSLMKKGAFLINTARGPVVEEAALIDALENHQIAGAGLDVYEFEPRIGEALLRSDKVVLTPHTGTGTVETRLALAKATAENIRRFFAGEKPEFMINPEVCSDQFGR